MFATKDLNVTQYASTQPGVPIVYLNGNTILLDRPSEVTELEITENAKNKLGLTENEQKVLEKIKAEKRLKEMPKPKRKKPQNPNPLRYNHILKTVVFSRADNQVQSNPILVK